MKVMIRAELVGTVLVRMALVEVPLVVLPEDVSIMSLAVSLKTATNFMEYTKVEIEAIDFNEWNGQHGASDEMPLAVLTIVGYKFRETDEAIWVAGEIFTKESMKSKEDEVRRVTVIPKVCIKNIRNL